MQLCACSLTRFLLSHAARLCIVFRFAKCESPEPKYTEKACRDFHSKLLGMQRFTFVCTYNIHSSMSHIPSPVPNSCHWGYIMPIGPFLPAEYCPACRSDVITLSGKGIRKFGSSTHKGRPNFCLQKGIITLWI